MNENGVQRCRSTESDDNRPSNSVRRRSRIAAFGLLCAGCAAAGYARDSSTVPAWLYPTNPPVIGAAPPADALTPVHLAGSAVTMTAAQLNDLFSAPDWYPDSHPAMPASVAHGRPPHVYACGFCHSPRGQGRPENASIAGLPASYIVAQVRDFKSGARRSAWHGDGYTPTRRMVEAATHATDEEVAAAADYFSKLQLGPRTIVAERATIPKTRVLGWVYVTVAGAGEEPLGERVIEIAPDPERHEKRDDRLLYIAYVPVGSIARGRKIAATGGGRSVACISCHGAELKGAGVVPPLAGRSPTYVMRQLLAFQTRSRHAAAGAPMQAVVDPLTLPDMIAVAAYAGSLAP